MFVKDRAMIIFLTYSKQRKFRQAAQIYACQFFQKCLPILSNEKNCRAKLKKPCDADLC